jgi:competence protein ComEC
LGGTDILHVRGKRALAVLDGCGGASILVTDQKWEGLRPCLVLDAEMLARTGAVAGWVEDGGLRLVSVAALSGVRPWTCPTRIGEECRPPSLTP